MCMCLCTCASEIKYFDIVGLGSHLCQAVRDEFPTSYIMSCVVAPHRSGESPLQHYNSLLCLSTLQQ